MSQSPSTLRKIFGGLLGRTETAASGTPKPPKKQPPFNQAELQASLQLKFPVLRIPDISMHWSQAMTLQSLVNLPSNALYGPDQKDKADAWELLKQLVENEILFMNAFDLRELHGLNHNQDEFLQYENWDDLSRSAICRQVRIISIRDYDRALAKATNEEQGAQLLTTRWFGDRYFWAREQNSCEFIASLVYARLRGLPMVYPVQIRRIQINEEALAKLQQHYYMLALQPDAWADSAFMHYLVNHKIPYARLPLLRGPGGFEAILLPRNNPLSSSFGQGLQAAGAQDLCEFLLQLNRFNPVL